MPRSGEVKPGWWMAALLGALAAACASGPRGARPAAPGARTAAPGATGAGGEQVCLAPDCEQPVLRPTVDDAPFAAERRQRMELLEHDCRLGHPLACRDARLLRGFFCGVPLI